MTTAEADAVPPLAAGATATQPPIFPAANDLAAALAQARTSGKSGVAVLFEMTDCGECARLRAGTLQDPGLLDYYQRHFITLGLHADTPTPIRGFSGEDTLQTEFAEAQGVRALPTLVLFDLDGTPVAHQVGSKADLSAWLRIGRYVTAKGYEEAPLTEWKPRD